MLGVAQIAERCEAQGDCKGSKTGLRLGLCEWPGWQDLGRGGEGVRGCTSSWCGASAMGVGKQAWVREFYPNDF